MSDNKGLPKNYTVSEVAEILRRTEQTIRKMIKDKKIPAIRVGGGYLVSQETIDKILRGDIELKD